MKLAQEINLLLCTKQHGVNFFSEVLSYFLPEFLVPDELCVAAVTVQIQSSTAVLSGP